MLQSILGGDESQPSAARSLELRDFFLEKKKKGRREREVYQGITKQRGDTKQLSFAVLQSSTLPPGVSSHAD